MTAALFNSTDHRYMAEAIRLAWRGLYTTHPNPRVGCVLVKGSNVIGRGWHQVAGEGHAEVNALADAARNGHESQIKGATAYVSLEPCSHYGKTPPCAEALIEAGVAKVISAMEDPNPQVSGRGHRLLQQAGIETACGLMQAEAEQINPGFNKRMRTGLPWVVLKSAMSVDGRTAMANGESQWITGPEARACGHQMRADHDAILVGVDTVVADDPALTCRLLGLEDRSPVRIVLDRRLRTPPTAALAATAGQTPTWIVTETPGDADQARALAGLGVEVITVAATADLAAVLAALADRGLTRLLVEGGGRVHASFFAAGVVDRIAWFRAPLALGGDGLAGIAPLGLGRLADAARFRRTAVRPLGDDVLETYERSD